MTMYQAMVFSPSRRSSSTRLNPKLSPPIFSRRSARKPPSTEIFHPSFLRLHIADFVLAPGPILPHFEIHESTNTQTQENSVSSRVQMVFTLKVHGLMGQDKDWRPQALGKRSGRRWARGRERVGYGWVWALGMIRTNSHFLDPTSRF